MKAQFHGKLICVHHCQQQKDSTPSSPNLPHVMYLWADCNSLSQLRDAPAKTVVQVKENHIMSVKIQWEVKGQHRTRKIWGQDLSLHIKVSFCDSLTAHEALDLLFHHLFHEPNIKEHLEQLTVDLWQKLILVHLTFSHSQPHLQPFLFFNSVFRIVKRSASNPTAIWVHRNSGIQVSGEPHF